jgi:phosphoglycerate dehydrogenase-like enzyme
MEIIVPDDYDRVYTDHPALARLRSRGTVRIFNDLPASEDALIARIAPAEVLIPIRERTPLTEERFARLPALRHIAMTGTGVASIDLKAATTRKILVTNTPRQSISAVAELTFGLLFSLLREIPILDREIRAGKWPEPIGRELAGKVMGILGLGEIGERVASLAQAFGMEVIAWGPTLTRERAQAHGVSYVPLEDLLSRADVVSLHLRVVPATKGVISKERLALLRPNAYLINTARAALVDEAAVWEALRDRRLAGAGLDVFGQEPLPSGHRWAQLPNVVLTSHRGFVTRETMNRFLEVAVENVIAWLDGRPQNVVNQEVLR